VLVPLLGWLVWLLVPSPLAAQGFLRGFVGVRVSVTDVRPETLEVDFDVTGYTQHRDGTLGGPPSGNPILLGTPLVGYPAFDFGDGSTVVQTTLPLATVAGGPGGTHVYRRSFTHSYPAPGSFRLTVGSTCGLCYSVRYYRSRTSAPTVITSYYRRPPHPIVTGHVAQTTTFVGTFVSPPYIFRRFTYFVQALTNGTDVHLAPTAAPIPAVSSAGLVVLGVLLAGAGLLLLRRGGG
jgi:hypothetical protein